MVPDNKIAWHAGKSKWKNFNNLNKSSIGIELVNKGHKFGYQNFTKSQITSLLNLCKKLKENIGSKNLIFLVTLIFLPIERLILVKSFLGRNLVNLILGCGIKSKKLNLR